MEVFLTEEERELLAGLLDSQIADLRSAVHHADSHQVKEGLKEKEATAKRLRAKLQHPDLLEVPVT